jgi:lipoate-protein ligase A
MNTSRAWRLVDSGMVAPAESAALDEALLDSLASGRSAPTLHFYVRSAPTVSLGYFQKASETVDLDACRRLGVTLVRRRSGGSSIYTDQGQLIFALVLPEEALPREREASFRPVCGAIARVISSYGLDARHRPVNDVEVGGRKLSGSAQLRGRGCVLHHGTVIADTDLSRMDAVLRAGETGTLPSERVTTMAALLGRAPDLQDLEDRLTAAFADALDAEFAPGAMTVDERAAVEKLVDERYSRDEWNLRR